MTSPTKIKIDRIADLLARFELGSVAQLAPPACHLLATAVAAFGRFPLGHELQDWLSPDRTRFASIREAFDGLSGPDQEELCVRLGLSSPALFRQALVFPGSEAAQAVHREAAQAILRLYRWDGPSGTSTDRRERFDFGTRTALANLVAMMRGPAGAPPLNCHFLASALDQARPDWDLRIQEILDFLGLLGVDPRKEADYVTRRCTFQSAPGHLFLYRHPMRETVTVLTLADGESDPRVIVYRHDLDVVKTRLAELLLPAFGTGEGELSIASLATEEGTFRADYLASNLEPAGADVPRNPFRRNPDLLALLERHLRLREAVAAVLAE